MSHSPPVSDALPAPEQAQASRSNRAPHLWNDRVLWMVFLAVGLLLANQLTVTLLHPAWMGPITEWLQILVAWIGLLVTVLVSHWITRTEQAGARSWWCVSAGLCSYALARTLWLLENQILSPSRVPQLSWHNFFIFLQYPSYLLALLLVPRVRPPMQRTLVALDTCLLLGAAFGLSWYFLLAPIYLDSQETGLAKLVNLSYPVGDLALFFGLTLIWLHYRAYALERAILALLVAAITCLFVADTWFALLLLDGSSYQASSPPDLFWLAFTLLLPLAGLVRVRLLQRGMAGAYARQPPPQPTNLRQHDLLAGFRVTIPIAAALLVSAVLFIRVELIANMLHPVAAPVIALLLLALALVRQFLTAMDNERLHRQREEALREASAQMETFLGIAGHELKSPLATMKLCLQVALRRLQQLSRREPDAAPTLEPVRDPVAQAERQEERLDRLVNDLLDVSRVRAGKLELHLEPTDLAPLVRETVEEHRQIYPERTLQLACPEAQRVPVQADAYRLGQVVTNYLTNALKYSAADRPVAVGLDLEEQQARVWVRDEGPGIPPEEQERIWERYHRVKGIEVQSGTGVGLGLGLPICRAIIEQHQGQVGVQSAPGQGSTFWFSLPLAPAEPDLERCEAHPPAGLPWESERQP